MSAAIFLIVSSVAIIPSYASAKNVIIVGGGASGMAAASKLCQGGIHDVSVLEAQDRLGGRIHSVTVGDAKVDLGAESIHGEKNNIIFETFKAKIGHTPKKMQQKLFVYSTGDNIDVELNKDLNVILNSSWGSTKFDNDELTMGGYFREEYKKILKKYGGKPTVLGQAMDALTLCEKAINSLDSSFSWEDVAADGPYEEIEGDKTMNWGGQGYVTVINYFKKHLMHPGKQIVLNKEISKVKWNDPQGVKLVAIDGSTFVADHVIFTPSLGFLKANHESVFDPPLPKAKVDAIKALGFGAVIKLVLQFPKKWWKDEDAVPMLVWSDVDLKRINTLYPPGVLNNGESWLPYFIGWAEAPANPNVIIGRFAGKLVPEIEKLTKNEIRDGVMFIIRYFFKKKYEDIPNPIKSLHCTWYSNPLFRGTYSYDTLKSNKLNGHVVLSEPLLNATGSAVLLFAGEATSHKHYSTVHGAVGTGYREAKRLLKQ